MKWLKCNPQDRIPKKNMLVTDGKTISIQYKGHRSSIDPDVGIVDMTHYMLLDDIDLPVIEDKE